MNQPKLEVRVKKLIEKDGLQFKDLNDNGVLDPYEDYRLSSLERAKDLVSKMDIDEKIGMMMINSRPTGFTQKNKELTSHDGIIDEEVMEKGSTIFTDQKRWGTKYTIDNLKLRHFILRENNSAKDTARWINAMNEICEGTRLGIPCIIASNSRNELGEAVFGMNDAVGVFSTWPGTLGLAAAAKGKKDNSIFTEFSKYARKEWLATGIRKGYMYMIDTVTDPRWQRIYGTFGEDTDLISDAGKRLIYGFQDESLNPESISLTMKHFPGGGARENGFDPHYKEGKFNVYKTEGSLEKYHLPPFIEAAKCNVTSIMPYYSIPSSEKSVKQNFEGEEIPFEDVGFAFNKYFLQDILRDKLGYKGYINSDSGIVDKMCWGVEDKTKPERAAKAINAGVDIISDTNSVEVIKEAYEKGMIPIERIDEANIYLLKEMFDLGLFDEKTYVDPDYAQEVVSNKEAWEKAYEAHLASVTLLKNTNNTLPLSSTDKVYVQGYTKELEATNNFSNEVNISFKDYKVDNLDDSDALVMFINPKSGNYFTSTPGLLELTICENKTNKAMDGSEYQETTVLGVDKIVDLAKEAKEKGKKVIVSVNFTLPWILEAVEPVCDALIAQFDTKTEAVRDVIYNKYSPTGVLPLTLPASEAVIAVDENGECVSRNDVPGYDKDLYMPEGMKYAYVDKDGNEYKLGHGLRY